MHSTRITALSYSVPSTSLTHQQLQDRFGAEKMDRVAESTGIRNRRVCAIRQIGSDLAYVSAEKILNSGDIARDSIDLLIVATQMPDYLLPTTACILQHKLGLQPTCAAFDINLGCSQLVYAHSVAHAMLVAGVATRALVITFDTPSKIIDPNDMTVVPLFGDGATAAILDTDHSGNGYQDFILGTDGSEHEALIWRQSGLQHTEPQKSVAPKPMTMEGQKIFLFTLQTVPKYIRELLRRNHIEQTSIAFFALHQASGLIVSSLAKKLKLETTQYNRIYQQYGNSGGSTVGISLWHALAENKLVSGDKIIFSAFGVGLSWGNALYQIGDELPRLY